MSKDPGIHDVPNALRPLSTISGSDGSACVRERVDFFERRLIHKLALRCPLEKLRPGKKNYSASARRSFHATPPPSPPPQRSQNRPTCALTSKANRDSSSAHSKSRNIRQQEKCISVRPPPPRRRALALLGLDQDGAVDGFFYCFPTASGPMRRQINNQSNLATGCIEYILVGVRAKKGREIPFHHELYG